MYDSEYISLKDLIYIIMNCEQETSLHVLQDYFR